nr:hypothetical protein [uncultured bacterium]
MNRAHDKIASCRSARRGAAVVAVLLAMLVIGFVMIGLVMGGARDQDLTVQRMNTVRAFYATEAGLNMAIREIILSSDEDSDGGIGSISNDNNDANNPRFGTANVFVTTDMPSPSMITLTSHATSATTARSASTTLSASAGFLGFGIPFGSEQQSVTARQIATKVTINEPVIVLSLSAFVNGPSPKETRYAIYDDLAGEPNALIVQSDADPVGGDSAHFHWFTLQLPSTPISAGDYWFALAFENTSMEYAFDPSGGQTRYNSNAAVANGYCDPWGVSTTSSTRRINIYATAATETTGNINFTGSTEYDNTDPQSTGLFRDVSNPTRIVRGNDVSSNPVRYSAINFTAAAGLVSDCLTMYDTYPATSTPTDFTGSVRVFADVLVTGTTSSRFIGLAALHNETIGQEGLVLVLRENGNQDELRLYRLPQNGDLTSAVHLATTGTFKGPVEGDWYRLVFDVMINGANIEVSGRLYSHSIGKDPLSPVDIVPVRTLSYTNTIASLPGLQTSGEVGICFDTTDASSRGSVTNFQINSGIGTSTSSVVVGWSEQKPY